MTPALRRLFTSTAAAALACCAVPAWAQEPAGAQAIPTANTAPVGVSQEQFLALIARLDSLEARNEELEQQILDLKTVGAANVQGVRDQLNAADGVLATDYIDAQRYRATLREEMLAVFREHHVLAMPTAPVLAPLVERADEYLTILSRNAILWSFVGFPAISVPAGKSASGLPIGLQVVCAPYAERTLIAVAAAAETD